MNVGQLAHHMFRLYFELPKMHLIIVVAVFDREIYVMQTVADCGELLQLYKLA